MKKFFADGTFYTLSRMWGQPATVIHKENTKLNASTGKQEFVTDTWSVRRALLLEERSFRIIKEQLGASYGGMFDQNERIIVVTKREMPKGKDFNTNDQIECFGERWRVKERTKLPMVSAYAAKVERVSDGIH